MPTENMISDQEIQKFELEAVETYGFKPEQALGNLRPYLSGSWVSFKLQCLPSKIELA